MQGRTLTVRVSRILPMTPDVRAFELVHPWGGTLPSYAAGAHLDVHTPGGFMRPYSLARAAAPGPVTRYVIGVKREPSSRGASAALHERVSEGDLLAVSTPRGSFGVQPGARHLLLAGGVGLTPLLAMAEALQREGRDFTLAVFARSRAHLAFADALAALGPRVRLHFDEAAAPQKIDLDALLAEAPAGGRLYLCGPAGFMQAVRRAAAHWPEDRVRAEYFAPPDEEGAGEGARRGGAAFTLRLARRGVTLPVAADQSAVEALAAIGVDIPTSCEQGLCGTCVVDWHASGATPEHRDFCLTGGERRRKVALCCSRGAAGGTLVVDL